MSEIELLPCPFCGGEAELNYERIPGEDKGYWAQVICKKCHGRSGGIWAGSYNAAERKEVKAWNTRKPMERIVERLHKTKVYSFQGQLPDGKICHFSDIIEIVKEGGVDGKIL